MRLIDADALKKYMDDCGWCDNCPDKKRLCEMDCRFPDFCTHEWQRVIDEQPTIAASPWHRVEEELPRGQELVIVAVKDTAGDTPFWYTQCGWITTDGEYWIVDNEICDYVVAWMPLPEPPKEGE